jgi:hypothetical protein
VIDRPIIRDADFCASENGAVSPNKRQTMNLYSFSRMCAVTALVALGAGFNMKSAVAQQQNRPDGDPGVEVLTRGPVHEAFAETVSFNPEPGIVAPKAPREIIEEIPPDQRPDGVNVTWIPGYWAWDDERNDYLWISGIWRDLPPGRQWVPGYWGQTSEGYQWTSGYWADGAVNETQYLPEPPESVEIGPNIAAPAPNLGWVPGSWLWQQNRYAWRPGYWAAGRPDWVWVPAHYIWAPRGYVFSDGYWDYTTEHRGVLFAPVYFEPQVYTRPAYTYSPTFAINLAVFSDQLFIRPRYQHYYFGDYYATRYHDTGFFASFSYQSSHHGYDPIYAHQSWEHRGERDWERHDRDNFAHRRDFVEARPPRTLLAQRELYARPARSGETRIEVAASFDLQAKRKDSAIHYQKVDQAERQQLAQRGRAIQNTRGERQKLETKTVVAPKDKPSKPVEPAKVKLPKPQIVAKPVEQLGKGQAPPKRQMVPKPDPKVEPKAARTNNRIEATREPAVKKADPPTHESKAQPQTKKPDPQPHPPKGDPKDKKPKDEPKDKP